MILLTQNKEIINYNNIMGIHVVVESEKNTKIKAVGINKYFAILGEYKTKERAEEVLEEIVESYTNWNNLIYGQPTGICSPKYEMPKE